jgi:hypothetical protein
VDTLPAKGDDMTKRLIVSGVILGLTARCVPAVGDDGFRAKLAAGCHSDTECAALYQEADARTVACMKVARSDDECVEVFHDRTAALNLHAVRQEAVAADVREKNLAAFQADANEDRQVRADLLELHESCDDVATLTAAAAKARSQWAIDRYTEAAQQRRSQQVSYLVGEIGRETGRSRGYSRVVHPDGTETRKSSLPGMANPEALRSRIAEVRALVERLRCYDAAAATTAAGDVNVWATELDAAITAEMSCRATPQCLADRLVPSLCEAIAGRKDALSGIARERQNPSGYVNATLLHDLGEDAQIDAATAADLRKRYTAIAHRPFDDSRCSKLP